MNSARYDNQKKLLTLNQTAEKLSVTPQLLLTWNEQNILKPTITPEGEIGYTEEQINQLLMIRQLIQADKNNPERKSSAPSVQNLAAGTQPAAQSNNDGMDFFSVESNVYDAKDEQVLSAFTPAASNDTQINTPENGVKSSLQSKIILFSVTLLVVLTSSLIAIGWFKSEFNQAPQNNEAAIGADRSASVETSKYALTGSEAVVSPIQIKSEAGNDRNLHDGEDLNNKSSALNAIYATPTNVATTSVSTRIARVTTSKTSYQAGEIDSKYAQTTPGTQNLTTLASRTSNVIGDNNTAFDSNGDIKGDVKGPLTLLGGLGIIANASSNPNGFDAKNQIIFIGLGLATLLFLFQKRLVYVFKPRTPQAVDTIRQEKASYKVIEVGQKTDGTIVLSLNGKEYKISKPELYSESDQFFERLMDLTKYGTKEIEYEAMNDGEIVWTTPLSRLATRLGFVGIKRELFFPYLDSGIILSRAIYQEGRFPAIDILNSNSSALNPDTIGQDHYDTALEAQTLLKKALSLERIVSLIGESELSADDQIIYKRSKMLKNYMTQNFTVVEAQTEKKGSYVAVNDTVTDVRAILDGKVDSLEPEDLLFIGTLKDVEQKLATKKATQTAESVQNSPPQTAPPPPASIPSNNIAPK